MRLKKKERKEKKEKQLKFSHIHSLVPELASGFGPSLERSRVVEMLEQRGEQWIQSFKKMYETKCA